MKLGKLHIRRHHVPHIAAGLFALWLVFSMGLPLVAPPTRAHAALVALRSAQLSSPTADDTNVNYKISFTTMTNGPIGSFTFQICSNYLFDPTDICITPAGFDLSGAALNASSGVTDVGFQPVDPASPSKIVLSRPVAAAVSPQPVWYEFTGVHNPADIGSYYVHISTFASTDGTGPEVDYGDAVFALNENIEITTEVPPYLYFCVGVTIPTENCLSADGGFISFGELSLSSPRAATSQMLAATNAAYGYSVTLAGTTMTAGNNVIPAMNGAPSQVGSSQFGLNARQNSGPSVGSDPQGPGSSMPTAEYNTPNKYRFVSGDIITTAANPDDYRKTTISYIVNRDRNQAPGRYVATVSYICLANF